MILIEPMYGPIVLLAALCALLGLLIVVQRRERTDWRSMWKNALPAVPFLGWEPWSPQVLGIPWWGYIIIATLVAGFLLNFLMGAREEGRERVRNFVGVSVVLVVAALILSFVPTQPMPGQIIGRAPPTMTIELSLGTDFDFAHTASDGATCPNPATAAHKFTLDQVNRQITYGLIGDHSAGTISPDGTTGTPDQFCVKATITRTDPGWVEAGNTVKVPVNARADNLANLYCQSNNLTKVSLLDHDSLLRESIAWTDFAAEIVVGVHNRGFVGELGGTVPSDTVQTVMYHNEAQVDHCGDGGATSSLFTRSASLTYWMGFGGDSITYNIVYQVTDQQ